MTLLGGLPSLMGAGLYPKETNMEIKQEDLNTPRMTDVKPLLELNIVLSTAHLTPDDAKILNKFNPQIGDLCTWNDEFSIIISMPETPIKDAKGDDEQMSKEFWQLLEYVEVISKDKALAPVKGLRKIIFDMDGDIHPQLPVYDW